MADNWVGREITEAVGVPPSADVDMRGVEEHRGGEGEGDDCSGVASPLAYRSPNMGMVGEVRTVGMVGEVGMVGPGVYGMSRWQLTDSLWVATFSHLNKLGSAVFVESDGRTKLCRHGETVCAPQQVERVTLGHTVGAMGAFRGEILF